MKQMLYTPSRRLVVASAASLPILAACGGNSARADDYPAGTPQAKYNGSKWRDLTEEEWRARLSPAAFKVLRKEDTERRWTSELNDEKRPGTYHCAGCDLPLFSHDTKYDSGTGWPSFWDHLPGAFGTKDDNKLFYTRTEYHCARCLGHQGHVFTDGPPPTGERWCNNGVALVFRPA